MATATVGKFVVTLDEVSGKFTVEGPKAYLESRQYKECIQKIASGRSAVINYAPTNVPLAQLIGVAIQTDFAGWLGFQQTFGGLKKA